MPIYELKIKQKYLDELIENKKIYYSKRQKEENLYLSAKLIYEGEEYKCKVKFRNRLKGY